MIRVLFLLVPWGAFLNHVAAQAGMLSLPAIGHVSVPHAANLVPASAFTIESWFYYDPAAPSGGSAPTIARKNHDNPSYILRVNGGVEFYVRTPSGLFSFQTPSPAPALAWHHAAGTYDGTTAKIYVDGILAASSVLGGSVVSTGGNLILGAGALNTNETWRGYVDEIRLWSVARTAPELQASLLVELGPTPGLVSAWRFNGSFQDAVSSNHGTPMGAATIVPSTSPVRGDFLVAPGLSPVGSGIHYTIEATQTGTAYLFDVSVSGTIPGVVLPPPLPPVPLNPPFLNTIYGGALPTGTFVDFTGNIDGTGHAYPILNVPPLSALAGLTVSATYLLLNPQAPFGIQFAGNPTGTVITDFPPVITQVAPPYVPQSGGTTLTITGTGFQSGATVHVGLALATNVGVASPTTLTCTTPPGGLGPADVRVTNPDTNSTVFPGQSPMCRT